MIAQLVVFSSAFVLTLKAVINEYIKEIESCNFNRGSKKRKSKNKNKKQMISIQIMNKFLKRLAYKQIHLGHVCA